MEKLELEDKRRIEKLEPVDRAIFAGQLHENVGSVLCKQMQVTEEPKRKRTGNLSQLPCRYSQIDPYCD